MVDTVHQQLLSSVYRVMVCGTSTRVECHAIVKAGELQSWEKSFIKLDPSGCSEG